MPTIKSLFDENLTFERRVEKVITFSNRREDVLKNEARDYVLTDNLTSEYERLLNFFDDAQSGNGSPECCTWLSGFYGSGKSSFAKYFGLCFDPGCKVGDKPFHVLFTARFDSEPLRQRIKVLTQRYNTAVFLLDLAAQGLAGTNNTPISTLLFNQVCAWAGYPAEQKVADLIMRLELDGHLEDFKTKVSELSGISYEELMGQQIMLIQVASILAHEYYPNVWKSADAFVVAQSISAMNDQDRVRQMLDLIEKKSGTRRVLFIIDEVGHFLINNQNLINNLDGLAKNLKEVGEGRAWMIATAQQTIPKSGPLYGLQDRFPIKIDLKASDIREITHKRLLKKSAHGEDILKAAFQEHGQRLTHSTKLSGSGCDAFPALTPSSFVDFYPLLPQQFELLIEAIRSLARTHGGVGLRSAIRCVEEILINNHRGGSPLISEEFGTLITAADIYAVLEKDIVSVAREITLHVDAVSSSYGVNSLEHQVAMSIAVLQQIDGFPISRSNVAAFLHPRVDAKPMQDEIAAAIETLLANPLVPIGETDQHLSFLSEVVSQVEKERSTIPVTSTHRETVQSKILQELFSRPPKTIIEGSKTVDSGIVIFDGNREQEIVGSDKDIKFLLRLVDEPSLESTRNELVHESLSSQNKAKIYICAVTPANIKGALEEIYKSEEIRRMHRSHPDQEVVRYLDGQNQLITQKRIEIGQALRESFTRGWFIFRGQSIAVDTLGADLEASTKAKLTEVAAEVFKHYPKAAINVAANVAEAFLRTSDISQITRERDPLKLVSIQGTATEVNIQHPALAEILAFFQRHPNPDGKRILTEFSDAPYGWNKETIRYLLAALFYAQKIKLKVNGEDLTVIGEQSLEAFKNNTSFNKVTVNPNNNEEPAEVRQAAAARLKELTGEQVIPLPQRIAEVATKYLPKFQSEIQGIPIQVQPLGVDTERLSRLQRSLNEALMGDGAGATLLFGAAESEIYDDLIWARALKESLKLGALDVLTELADLNRQVTGLNQLSLLPELQEIWAQQSSDILKKVKQGSFVTDVPGLAQKLDDLKLIVNEHCGRYCSEQKSQARDQITSLIDSPDFKSLDPASQETFQAKAESAMPYLEPTITGIQSAPQVMLGTFTKLQQIRSQIQSAATPKPAPTAASIPQPDALPAPTPAPQPGTNTSSIPRTLKTTQDLDQLIAQLETLRKQLENGTPITLSLDL